MTAWLIAGAAVVLLVWMGFAYALHYRGRFERAKADAEASEGVIHAIERFEEAAAATDALGDAELDERMRDQAGPRQDPPGGA